MQTRSILTRSVLSRPTAAIDSWEGLFCFDIPFTKSKKIHDSKKDKKKNLGVTRGKCILSRLVLGIVVTLALALALALGLGVGDGFDFHRIIFGHLVTIIKIKIWIKIGITTQYLSSHIIHTRLTSVARYSTNSSPGSTWVNSPCTTERTSSSSRQLGFSLGFLLGFLLSSSSPELSSYPQDFHDLA